MGAERISADLFGRRCRLPIAIWILGRDKPRFYQSEPPPELASPTAIRQELARLTRAGMLDEERPDGENRVYYVRTDSAWWEVIKVARQILSDEGAADV
jgi:DNA-binding transcriptional ArsR family regulator